MRSSQATTQLQRNLYALAVGTVAGTTVGLCGWGGAQVIIPSMTAPFSFASYSQLAATGVSLSSLSVSACSSGFRFWKEDSVNLPLALAVGLPAVLSARAGTHFAKRLSGDALALFFNGFSILLIPTHYFIQQRAKERTLDNVETITHASSTNNKIPPLEQRSSPLTFQEIAQHSTYGLCSGIISALMGVGGLPLTMSYLTEATHLPHHHVQGTAVVALLPSILVSALSRVNAIPFIPAMCVASGAMIGGYGGAQFALRLSEEQLRNVYMASLVIFGSRSALGAGRNIRNILAKR